MLPQQAAAWPDSLGKSFIWLMRHSFLEEVDWITNFNPRGEGDQGYFGQLLAVGRVWDEKG